MAALEILRSSFFQPPLSLSLSLCQAFLFFPSQISYLVLGMGSRCVTYVLSFGLILLILAPLCSPEPTVATVDAHAARELMCNEEHRYLDVRTVDEFNKGHPEGAINVPYIFFTPEGRVKNKEFIDEVSKVCSKDDYIVVGCLSGVRSLQATADLLNAGFKHAKNMGGGFAAWTENGFTIKKPQSLL